MQKGRETKVQGVIVPTVSPEKNMHACYMFCDKILVDCLCQCYTVMTIHVRVLVSDLRIVLLGKNASENNKVGNLILNENVFEKKTFPPDVDVHSGEVKGRNITVISTIHLLNPEPKLHKISQKVADVSRLEPHVIILVLQHNDFSEKKRDRLSIVLNYFSNQAMKRTIILTTDDEKRIAKQKLENEFIQDISSECGGECLQLQNTQCSQILQKVDEIITGFKETLQSSLWLQHQGDSKSFIVATRMLLKVFSYYN